MKVSKGSKLLKVESLRESKGGKLLTGLKIAVTVISMQKIYLHSIKKKVIGKPFLCYICKIDTTYRKNTPKLK